MFLSLTGRAPGVGCANPSGKDGRSRQVFARRRVLQSFASDGESDRVVKRELGFGLGAQIDEERKELLDRVGPDY